MNIQKQVLNHVSPQIQHWQNILELELGEKLGPDYQSLQLQEQNKDNKISLVLTLNFTNKPDENVLQNFTNRLNSLLAYFPYPIEAVISDQEKPTNQA